MRLLTKINEFAKQRSIHLTVMYLQRRCFAGRETAMAILQKAKLQCDATGVCVCVREIIRYHTKVFLQPILGNRNRNERKNEGQTNNRLRIA